jgi:Ca2+/H+ antiporter
LNKPVQASEIPVKAGNPAGPILAFSTVVVGVLIAVAGLISGSNVARMIDSLVGVVLIGIGVLFYSKSSKAPGFNDVAVPSEKE